jgi:DNA-binding transcriptional MerR regulator
MAAGLRRRDHFDERLGALNPNIALPTHIASQIVDSQYFTRFIGAELADGHAVRTAAEDQERAVQAAAAERGAPLQELRALVQAMQQRPPPEPFAGQAAHEARAQQADLQARLADHQRGLVEVHRLAFTTRVAQAELQDTQRNNFQNLTRIAEEHGAAIGAQGAMIGAQGAAIGAQGAAIGAQGTMIGAQGAATAAQNAEMTGLREQFRRQGRRYAANFRARASSSSASEPGAEAEPRGRPRGRA